MGEKETTSNSLPAIVAAISLVYNILFAVICTYLPYDPLYLGLSISIYAWAGCALSVVGLVGVVTQWATLITAFSHYLFMDTFLSAVCRMVALELFTESFRDHHVCSNAYTSPWREEHLTHDVVTSAHWRQHMQQSPMRTKRCRVALDVVQILLMVLLIALTVAQGTLAMAMRRYGKDLEKQSVRRSEHDTAEVRKLLVLEKC